MAEPALEPGRILAGKYRLGERLGEGGMGAVYRAEHLVLQAPVAIKVIEREIVADEATKARFAREAQAAAALRSPHVVQILDYGTEGDLPYMVMELLEGETLAQRIRRKRRLSANETSWVLSHIGRAVAKAHELGIVHRDLKPDNVFLVKNEDVEIAKVLDFGIAKVDSTALKGGGDGGGTHTRTGSLLGTPYYMSPEQAQGNKAIDHRSDLWALGVIAFECLTGKRPFSSDGLGDLVLQICIRDVPVPSQVAPVPLGFDAWFEKATQRELDARFQSAKELTEALREALGIETREAPSVPDLLVSSGVPSSIPPEERAVDAGAATVAEESLLKSSEFAISDATRRLNRAAPKAPEAPAPSKPEQPAPDVSAFTEPQAKPRSGARTVLGVGVAALALGALVGVIALGGRPGGFRVGDLTTPDSPAVRPLSTSQPNAVASAEKVDGQSTAAKSESNGKRPSEDKGAPVGEPSAPAIPEAAAAVSAAAPESAPPTTSSATPEQPSAPASSAQAPSTEPPKDQKPESGAPDQSGSSAPGPSPVLPEQLSPPKSPSDAPVQSAPSDGSTSNP